MNPHSDRPLGSSTAVRFFLLLLLIAAGTFAFVSSLGCGIMSSVYTDHTTTNSGTGKPYMQTLNPGTYHPGDQVQVKLGGTTAMKNLRWYPPYGATNVRFEGAIQPQPGGPPYIFKDVSEANALAGMRATYTAPGSDSTIGRVFLDVIEARSDDGTVTSQTSEHHLAASPSSRQAAISPPQPILLPQAPVSASAAISIPTWEIIRFTDPTGITLTTSLCQQYVQEWQSANRFIAWRVPISGAIAPDQAYSLPFVKTSSFTPTLSISGFRLHVPMPLEFRPESMPWAQGNLPAYSGQRWITLGASRETTVTCPAAIDLAPGNWFYMTRMRLDLSGQPDLCESCVLPAYFCYRAEGNGGIGYEAVASGEPFCVGPADTALVDGATAQWRLDPLTLMTNVTATQPITVHYWIENYSDVTQTFTITLASNLAGATWRLYPSQRENLDAPDTTTPLGSQIQSPAHSYSEVPGNNIWMLSTAPAGASGQYTVSLTAAANPALIPVASRGTTIIWVGAMPQPAPVSPAVGIRKTAAPDPVQAGGLLTYTLYAANTGALPLTSLVVSDTVPASTTYQGCNGADSCALDGDAVRWNLATLGTGQSAALQMIVRVDADAAAGSKITNRTYAVNTGEGVTAAGAAVEVSVGEGGQVYLYLPVIIR